MVFEIKTEGELLLTIAKTTMQLKDFKQSKLTDVEVDVILSFVMKDTNDYFIRNEILSSNTYNSDRNSLQSYCRKLEKKGYLDFKKVEKKDQWNRLGKHNAWKIKDNCNNLLKILFFIIQNNQYQKLKKSYLFTKIKHMILEDFYATLNIP